MRIAAVPQRRYTWAALLALLVMLCALAAAVHATRAPASLQSRLDAKKHKLDRVERQKGVLTTTISHFNDRIDRLVGEVAGLRNREAAVQSRLDVVQRQLDRAEARLKVEKGHLLVLRAHLKRALVALRGHLVSVYKSGTPDILTVLLNSKGWSDLVTRSDYLTQLRDQDQLLIGRVRDLKNATRSVVDRLRGARDRIETARNAIAARKQQIERTRSAIETHQSALESARGKRRDALAKIVDHEQQLDGDVADLQSQIAAKLAPSNALPVGPVQGGGHGLIWPVNGPVVSGFGWRFGGGEFHEGDDIAVPTGTPIRAAASGTVSIAAWTGGYGNYTCIDHGGGLSTCYGHQESFAVSAGQTVTQGQVIGYSDCTGHCFGPHVHFEVRINGQAVDPMGYL
jgi:murein DD-endopeptidase MepM/ murein hydrolase activator NlpD